MLIEKEILPEIEGNEGRIGLDSQGTPVSLRLRNRTILYLDRELEEVKYDASVFPYDGSTLSNDGNITPSSEAADVPDAPASVPDPKKAYIIRGWAVSVRHPLNLANAIDACERTAYNLLDDRAVASFQAGLSRKFREDPNDPFVHEHDFFIRQCKQWLHDIGITY